MKYNYNSFLLAAVLLLGILSFSVEAFEFNGTVLDVSGNALNNSLVNITIRNTDFSIYGYNSTTTNASGWFNLTVADVTNAFYEMRLTWTNTTTNSAEWVGQNMPAFPSQALKEIAGTSYYLREAGTFNVTAVNTSGGTVSFRYQIKDQKLGYPVASNFDSLVNFSSIILPRDRNYSILIYPDASMPVSFNWNNFSSASSYTINPLSLYNVTTRTLHYRFNTTTNLVQVTGYLNYSGINGWDEFNVVPYLLEPGNMVHLEFGDLPFNLSSAIGGSDVYNLTSGFYNISLPSTPAETSLILLFATARNGSTRIGGFRNISSVGSGLNSFNFTSLYPLLGTAGNITMDTLGPSNANVSTAKQVFTIVNASNSTMENINGHIEVTVDYSSYQAIEFTWMLDIEQGSVSNFSVPLLNATGIKEMNVFLSGGAGDFAPKKKTYTVADLQTRQRINVTSFNPGDVDGAALSGLKIALLKSNSSCDLPAPNSACYVGSSESGQAFGEEDGFNPMSAILGGGKLSFRMGLLSSGIMVHYVNVDMLASGPPDALFDDSTTTDTSSGFSAAMRFGSGGPSIYDFVLISLPYAETAGTGLDDSGQVTMNISILYDDDWNVIWNTSTNGSDASALAGNFSHYAARQAEWGYLLNSSVCGTDQTVINYTRPCFINTSNNRIWVRLPHFSGTSPSITGSTVAAVSSSSSSSSSSSGGSGGGSCSRGYTKVGSGCVKDVVEESVPEETPAAADDSETAGNSNGGSADSAATAEEAAAVQANFGSGADDTAADAKGKSALAGQAFSGLGQVLVDQSLLWIVVMTVVIVAGVGAYFYRRKD
ncbi:MAG TPA: hypothetical protein VJI15_01160 [Candidatus Nanoarchaeia archaeon]|nr:hypothetical protein [Candidatus Nanoarchaeia archaeon]